MKFKRIALVTASAVIIGSAGYFLLWPVPIDPVAWTPGPNPGRTGVFAPNDYLGAVELLISGSGEGPEDVTRGPDGYFYTGLQDGRIMRFGSADDAAPTTFVSTGGRPLGLQFDSDGNLIVADAFRGLLSVSPSGELTVLTDNVAGRKMLFVDDLDIADDGTIWFSDASQRFDQHHYMLDFLEGRATGRLLTYSPRTGKTEVHLEGLSFANGVALGPDEAYVLVNETLAARITRLWLMGPKAGTHEAFIEGLPAYPDNLSYNGRGIFWVALPALRNEPLEKQAGRPLLRKVIMRLPKSLREIPIEPFGWVIGIDLDGKVVYNLQGPSGHYATVTSVNEFAGDLYLGSIKMDGVGRIPAP